MAGTPSVLFSALCLITIAFAVSSPEIVPEADFSILKDFEEAHDTLELVQDQATKTWAVSACCTWCSDEGSSWKKAKDQAACEARAVAHGLVHYTWKPATSYCRMDPKSEQGCKKHGSGYGKKCDGNVHTKPGYAKVKHGTCATTTAKAAKKASDITKRDCKCRGHEMAVDAATSAFLDAMTAPADGTAQLVQEEASTELVTELVQAQAGLKGTTCEQWNGSSGKKWCTVSSSCKAATGVVNNVLIKGKCIPFCHSAGFKVPSKMNCGTSDHVVSVRKAEKAAKEAASKEKAAKKREKAKKEADKKERAKKERSYKEKHSKAEKAAKEKAKKEKAAKAKERADKAARKRERAAKDERKAKEKGSKERTAKEKAKKAEVMAKAAEQSSKRAAERRHKAAVEQANKERSAKHAAERAAKAAAQERAQKKAEKAAKVKAERSHKAEKAAKEKAKKEQHAKAKERADKAAAKAERAAKDEKKAKEKAAKERSAKERASKAEASAKHAERSQKERTSKEQSSKAAAERSAKESNAKAAAERNAKHAAAERRDKQYISNGGCCCFAHFGCFGSKSCRFCRGGNHHVWPHQCGTSRRCNRL
jgi:hypothetical protein